MAFLSSCLNNSLAITLPRASASIGVSLAIACANAIPLDSCATTDVPRERSEALLSPVAGLGPHVPLDELRAALPAMAGLLAVMAQIGDGSTVVATRMPVGLMTIPLLTIPLLIVTMVKILRRTSWWMDG